MRRTGRTTRIVQYVVEQLHNVGTCIATDHTVYEYAPKIEMVKHFEKEVKNKIYSDSKGVKTVNSAIMIINEVPYVKFEMIDAK
jgi:hypothetical protein